MNLTGRGQAYAKKNDRRLDDRFSLVGDKGLEPSTSRSQTARASQLRQSPLLWNRYDYTRNNGKYQQQSSTFRYSTAFDQLTIGLQPVNRHILIVRQ